MRKILAFLAAISLLFALAMTAAAAEPYTAGDVEQLLSQLPSLKELQTMSQEEQRAVYDQTQAAYDAYQTLSSDDQASVEDAEAKFQELFDYFNTLVMPLEETVPEEPQPQKKEVPWAFTALILALVITFFQNMFIHGRRR